jgi:delta 1-pyrroline-5-carboxylate dehydrogenase
MQEEIFGPILPFVTVKDENEAITFINKRSKPLALYVFSSSRSLAKKIIDRTSAGSTCVNDVIFQIAPSCLPFGGVGESGLGSYHGKYSFDAFSHHRSVVYSATWAERLIALRNPPYSAKKTATLATLAKVPRQWLPLPKCSFWFWAFLTLAVSVTCRIVRRFVREGRLDF